MNGQTGSVLAGVIAISVILSVAASGYLFVMGNSGKDEVAYANDQTLHYAAESAMYLAVKWIRGHSKAYHDDTWNGSLVLTPGPNGYSNIDGALARVDITGLPGGPPLRRLRCHATAGAGKDTLVLTWLLDKVDPDPGDALKCIPFMSTWQESYNPGNP
ncbi:MAG: hypothetical protein ABIW76_14225 [Fibrobacteria bacterium]